MGKAAPAAYAAGAGVYYRGETYTAGGPVYYKTRGRLTLRGLFLAKSVDNGGCGVVYYLC